MSDGFGTARFTYGTDGATTPFQYRGQYYDEESGLYYLRNRYYNPELGRFITEDPYWNANNMIHGDDKNNKNDKYEDNNEDEKSEIKIPDYAAIAQSLNLYLYCINNPLRFIDPAGTVAYEAFRTLEEAIRDWAWNNSGYTRVTGIEKGSALYAWIGEDGNDYYSYTWCDVGGYGYCDPQRVQNDRPDGTMLVGYIHSHYEYPYLSKPDIDLAHDGQTSIYMVFVENGKGFVDAYRRRSNGGYQLTENIYEIKGYKPYTPW